MKVSSKFKTIRDFQLMKHGRKCWINCYLCGTELVKGNTDYVHMTIVNRSETRFICDKCENDNKDK